MDDNANGVVQAVDEEDLNTTAPNPPDEWRMPDPVFRKTSGRLPQGFEKELENARAEHAASPPERPSPATLDISQPEPKPKNPTVKLILVLLGLAAMIAFIAVFLTLVYFFILR